MGNRILETQTAVGIKEDGEKQIKVCKYWREVHLSMMAMLCFVLAAVLLTASAHELEDRVEIVTCTVILYPFTYTLPPHNSYYMHINLYV